MKSAANSVRASFISSDGCRRNCPKPTQRLDPIGGGTEARDQHHEEEAERHQEDEGAEPPQLAVVEADGRPQRDAPIAIHMASLMRMAHGEP